MTTQPIMSYLDFLKKAEYFLCHPDRYTYCLGACGELAESDRVRNLYEWYYNNGYREKGWLPYSTWLAGNRGKRCYDCSGFIDYILFGEGNHKLSSWSFGEMPKNESLSKGTEASILWKKGHVGIDLGHGYFAHFPNINRTIEYGKITEYDWTTSHHCTYIDYEGATDL